MWLSGSAKRRQPLYFLVRRSSAYLHTYASENVVMRRCHTVRSRACIHGARGRGYHYVGGCLYVVEWCERGRWLAFENAQPTTGQTGLVFMICVNINRDMCPVDNCLRKTNHLCYPACKHALKAVYVYRIHEIFI